MGILDSDEFSPFKILFLLNGVFVFFLIVLLFLHPSHTRQAEIYGWFFVGFAAFLAIDLLLSGFPYSEIIDTITFEVNEERFPLQKIAGGSIHLFFIGALAIGLLWGGIYAYNVTTQQKAFITVPNLFTVQPLTAGITQEVFDIIETSWMVATVEESIWSGLMFPIIWAVLFAVSLPIVKNEKAALILSLLIASMLSGYLVAFVFHSFVFEGNVFAFAAVQNHFTTSALLTGVTGTTMPSIIAHAIHNASAKIALRRGTFEAIPLEAFIAQEQARTQQQQIVPPS